jgi:thiamine pyrophosphokinase
MGGKIDLVRTFMVCIDGSALFLKVVKCFPVLLCGDFWSSLLAEF